MKTRASPRPAWLRQSAKWSGMTFAVLVFAYINFLFINIVFHVLFVMYYCLDRKYGKKVVYYRLVISTTNLLP